MNTDLTFITNEKDSNLLERFKVLIKDTKLFDVLVGYFRTGGFYNLIFPRKRAHSSLGYMSPFEFEKQLVTSLQIVH